MLYNDQVAFLLVTIGMCLQLNEVVLDTFSACIIMYCLIFRPEAEICFCVYLFVRLLVHQISHKVKMDFVEKFWIDGSRPYNKADFGCDTDRDADTETF